ncbi:hypothetical protein BDU57DRAFT_303577 [Ampelomyces quisqualis]|uniref:BTB domain-containing protein n=1 Tax=Ampelomyces quisqualis TaxID=50730 RepID=A0A6A5QGQ7_AMPQU|nr:hypothetical protein BDU57DRAFT_303577 [Ampelomyces quisqualis]
MGCVKRSYSEMQGKTEHLIPSDALETSHGFTSDSDGEVTRPSKKSKHVHVSSSADEDEALEDPQEFDVQITQDLPATAVVAGNDDKKINDVSVHAIPEDAAQPAVPPPRPPRFFSTSFTPLPPVLASDMANNNHAPSEPQTRQQYMNEVGNLQLHPSRTPLQTPHSKVSAQIRNVIYERLFLGMTNDECKVTYNSFGGSVTRGASVSKAFLPEVWKWFEEENVVLPWLGRKEYDKKRLKKMGLVPKNFPAPYATVIVGKKSKEKSRKPVVQPPNMAAIQPDASTSVVADLDLGATVQLGNLKDIDDYEESASDSEGSESDSETEEDHVASRRTPVVTRSQVRFDEEDTSEPSIHVLMRAATNAFGRIGEDDPVTLIVNEQSFMVNADALETYCGFIQDNLPKEGQRDRYYLSEQDPVIVRAFVDTISPVPRDSLPEHDIEFTETHNFLDEEHNDPLGIINGGNRTVRKIIWDIDTLVMMYQLAKALRCAIIQDMVIDRIQRMHRNEQRQKRARPWEDVKNFELPLYYVPYLSVDEDAAFLHCIGGILLNRADVAKRDFDQDASNRRASNKESGFEWSEEFSKEMIHSIVQHYEACPVSGEMICQHYHVHGAEEQCYKAAGHGWEEETQNLTSELFSELRNRAAQANDEALQELQEGQQGHPDEEDEYEVQRLQGEMLQFSLRRGMYLAELLREMDGYRRRITMGRGYQKTIRKKLLACQKLFENCCHDHQARWEIFVRGWTNDDEDFRWEIETDAAAIWPWEGK